MRADAGPSHGPGPALRLEGVRKAYRRVRALEHLDLEVARGEVLVLAGVNGSGKTTVLKLAAGLARPDRGRVHTLGRDPRGGPPLGQQLGVLLDVVAPDPRLTGRQHLAQVASWASPDPLPVEAQIAAFELGPYADARVGGYSTGMRRRLGLAAALLADPPLALLDEPTDGLDPWARDLLADRVAARTVAGRTTVVASHDLGWATQLAHRALGLAAGQVVADLRWPGPAPVDDQDRVEQVKAALALGSGAP